MLNLTPTQVAETTRGRLSQPASTPITTVVTDSREAAAGSLFIAIPGQRADGHDFVGAARAQGAIAAIVSREVPGVDLAQIVVADPVAALGDLARAHLAGLRERRPELTVVAVTGSVGKTTTKDLLGALLAPLGPVVTPPASFNNEIGLPLTVLRATEDTAVLVLEMGADAPGNLAYLTAIAPPDVAAVLLVAGAHLEGFGTITGVAAEKQQILTGLREGGIGILNADDGLVAGMARCLDPERVRTYGESDGANYRAVEVRTDADGRAGFVLQEGPERTPVQLALVGEHNLTNALAAAAIARTLGVSSGQVADILGRARARSAHRMHLVDTPAGIRIIDDAYNANPTSMRAALKTLADMAARTGRRSVAVLGEMRELGADSILEHDAIGRLVVRLNIDKLLAVGPATRALHSGAYQEGSWGEEAHHVDTFEEAAAWFASELREGDIVLVKSSNGAGLAHLAEDLIASLSNDPAAEGAGK